MWWIVRQDGLTLYRCTTPFCLKTRPLQSSRSTLPPRKTFTTDRTALVQRGRYNHQKLKVPRCRFKVCIWKNKIKISWDEGATDMNSSQNSLKIQTSCSCCILYCAVYQLSCTDTIVRLLQYEIGYIYKTSPSSFCDRKRGPLRKKEIRLPKSKYGLLSALTSLLDIYW